MFWFYAERIAGYWRVFLTGLEITVGLSVLALVIGSLIGLAFGIIRAGRNRWLAGILGLYIDFFRGTPFLVQLFVVFFVLPAFGVEFGAFTSGVIALSNMAACFIAEIVAGGLRAVPAGQREAAIASGMTRAQQMRLVVMPQALRIITPTMVGQFVLIIKDSSVVAGVGLLDLTRAGWQVTQMVPNGLMVFGVVGIGYFVICYPLIYLARRLERRSEAAFL